MNTLAENILIELHQRLQSASLGASVERTRTLAFERDNLPGIVIQPASEESTPLATGLLICHLSVDIQIHTRGDIPDSLADPIAYGIHAAIRQDPTFGGLAIETNRTGKSWEFSDSDGTGGKLVMTYQITYSEPA